MRREPDRVILAALASLLACALQAQAATEAADPVDERIEILKDLTKADEERTRARDELATRADLIRRKSIDKLIALGKSIKAEKAEGTEAADNIRMQVACALSHVSQDSERAKIAANLALLEAWHQGKEHDAALRYWAGMAIANVQTAAALASVKKTLEAAEDVVACTALAREIGRWKGKGGKPHKLALPVLVGLLSHKSPEARLAGIDGLRFTKLEDKAVILPLAKVAAEDPDAPVWHAAVTVLRELTRRSLIVRPDATAAQRKETLRVWEFEWLRAHK